MKIINLFITLTAISLLSSASAASKKKGFAAIDSNGDGTLTLKEYTDAVIKRENVRWKADSLTDEKIKEATDFVVERSKLSFESFDMNRDGKVKESEIAAYQKGKRVGDAPAAPAAAASYDFPAKTPGFLKKRYKDHDANKDGMLNLQEFTKYLAVWLNDAQPGTDPVTFAPGLFRQKDKNSDGQLTPQEALSQYK